MDWLVKKSKNESVVVKLPQNISDEISINVDAGEKKEACTYHKHGVVTLKQKGAKLQKNIPYNLSAVLEEDEFTKKVAVFFPDKCDTSDGMEVCYNLPKEVLAKAGAQGGASKLKSPMTGKVLSVDVSSGDTVEKGECLMIIEAMKMENRILAPSSGVVDKLKAKAGEQVQANSLLCEIKSPD